MIEIWLPKQLRRFSEPGKQMVFGGSTRSGFGGVVSDEKAGHAAAAAAARLAFDNPEGRVKSRVVTCAQPTTTRGSRAVVRLRPRPAS